MIRTSQTHPIRVDAVPIRSGLLGLTFCPGKHGHSLNGHPWVRNLDMDLRALRECGAGLNLTLIEPHEFGLLRVPDFGARVEVQGMSWAHRLSWLDAAERGIVHCRGGLGQAGLVAALLLMETGTPAEAAIRTVRAAWRGAVETAAQARYVRAYVP